MRTTFSTATLSAALISLLCLPALAPSLKAQSPPPAAPAAPSDSPLVVDPAKLPDVVARVNGLDVTKRELLTQAEVTRQQVGGRIGESPQEIVAFYREILQGLIGEMLIYDLSRKEGKEASEAEVDALVDKMRKGAADPTLFDRALEAQGVPIEEFRAQLRRALSVENYLFEVLGAKVSISDAQKRAFYEENRSRMRLPERRRVRHILLRVASSASAEGRAEVRARAAALAARIRGGEDFAAVAEAESEDVTSKDRGGELPWILRTGERPKFEAGVYSAEVGKVTDPVETQIGYHLFEVLEVQPGRDRPYEEVEQQIGEHLKSIEIRRQAQEKVDSLRDTAKVEILL